MKILFLLFLPYLLFALSDKSCYTVQLMSAKSNGKNLKRLNSLEYDSSCRVFDIHNILTLRCGCFENKQDALNHLNKLKQNYKHSYITTTYKSRFNIFEKKDIVDVIVENIKPKIDDNQTKVKKTIVKLEQKKKKEEKKKKHKKHKKKKKHKKSKKEKTKKTVSKIEKKDKVKIIRKPVATFAYDRYLRVLNKSRYIQKYDFRYEFGAQFSYDAVYVSDADNSYFKRDIRRFRVSNSGSFLKKHLFYEFSYSLVDDSYKNVYIGYKDNISYINSKYRVKVGNIKIPFSLERYTSSKYTTFMERSLIDVFSVSRRVGVEVLLSKKFDGYKLNLFGAYFTNSIDDKLDNEDEVRGFSTRVVGMKKFQKDEILSIGFALRTQKHYGKKLKLKQSAESDFLVQEYMYAKVKDVDSVFTQNLEFLYIYDRFYFQSEYTNFEVKSIDENYNFYGFYLQGSYFLNGNFKKYKTSTSTLAKVKPTRGGAYEVAFRYAYLNFSDKDEGRELDYTLGLNYYMNDKMKLSFNYILANPRSTDDYDGVFQIWQTRVLFFF